jgi:hypothetical protein
MDMLPHDLVNERTRDLHEMRERIRLEQALRTADAMSGDVEAAQAVAAPTPESACDDCGTAVAA